MHSLILIESDYQTLRGKSLLYDDQPSCPVTTVASTAIANSSKSSAKYDNLKRKYKKMKEKYEQSKGVNERNLLKETNRANINAGKLFEAREELKKKNEEIKQLQQWLQTQEVLQTKLGEENDELFKDNLVLEKNSRKLNSPKAPRPKLPQNEASLERIPSGPSKRRNKGQSITNSELLLLLNDANIESHDPLLDSRLTAAIPTKKSQTSSNKRKRPTDKRKRPTEFGRNSVGAGNEIDLNNIISVPEKRNARTKASERIKKQAREQNAQGNGDSRKASSTRREKKRARKGQRNVC